MSFVPSWRGLRDRRAHARRIASQNRPSRLLRARPAEGVEELEVRRLLAVFHVSLAGDDANDGSAAMPLRSVQAALAAAAAATDGDDSILIASGTYDNVAFDGPLDIAQDLELDNLRIEGGYAADFSGRDLVGTPTIYAPQSGTTGITINDATVTLDGLQFFTAGFDRGIGISVGGVTLQDVAVTGGVLGVAASMTAAPTLVRVNVTGTSTAAFDLRDLLGPLTLDTCSANLNSGDGVVVENLSGDATVSAGTFNGNSGDGLSFQSTGRVTLTGVTASVNQRGLTVDTAAGVAISGSDFSENTEFGILIEHVEFPGANISGTAASATAGVGLRVFDAFSVQLIDAALFSTPPLAGGQIEDVGFFTHTASSGADDDLVQFRGGLLRHTRANVLRAAIEIDLDTGVTFNGGDGNDTLTFGVNSGYEDLVAISVGQIQLQLGPTPLEKPIKIYGYDGMETMNVATEGGNDTVTVTLAATGPLPEVLNIKTEDENDSLEINHAAMLRAITINIDGGGGTNGLTEFTRSVENDRATLTPGQAVLRLGPPTPARPDQTTTYTNIQGLTILTGAGDDTFDVHLGGQAVGIPIRGDLGDGSNDDFRVHTESGQADIVRLTQDAVSVQIGPSPELVAARTVRYSGAELAQLIAGGGNDSISIIEPAVGGLPSVMAFGQNDDDYIEVFLGDRHATGSYSIDGGAGAADHFLIFTNSGHSDIVTMEGTTITAQLGPEPGLNPAKIATVSNTEQATLRTAGGADLITITPPNSSAFYERVNVVSEDEADAIAVNLGASAANTAFDIDGGNGDGDSLTITDAPANNGTIIVDDVASPGHFGARRIELLSLLGTTGNDLLVNNTFITSVLNGGPGNDTLMGGPGFDFLLGGIGDDVMHGGGGIDVLLGSNGADQIFGDGGRDLLIGGTGGDFLDGGDDDDILIAATTSFDDQQLALEAILGEWTTQRPYTTRVLNLSGNGVGPRRNGDIFLIAGETLFEDTSNTDIDTLMGSGGLDLFYLNFEEDVLLDQVSPEASGDVTQPQPAP